jgi:hypothetical protein
MGVRTGIALALACLTAPAAASAAPVSDAFHKPLEDGCQRNVPGLLAYSSPEWVWVNSAQVKGHDNIRRLQGRVRDPHPAGEDLPENHQSYDFDFNVFPDPGYRPLAGGSPSANGGKGSGNWDHGAPDEFGQLHLEWESAVLPTFAWPDEGDRVSVWGQWIWDCGHWGEDFDFSAPSKNDPTAPITHTGDYLTPGETESELHGTPEGKNIRGEQTELHPLEALVVRRAKPYQATARESQTDAFMSTRGTGAHGEERCAHDSRPPAGLPFQGPAFTACVHDQSKEYQSLSGKTFAFTVKPPPKPSPGASMRFREVRRIAGHHAHEQLALKPDGLHVRVSFDRVPAGTLEDFGASWFVGWKGDHSGLPTHLRWTLESIKVNKSFDPNPKREKQTGVPPGEYNMYVDLNGYWNFVGGRGPSGRVTGGSPREWVPGLGAVLDGQAFSNIDRSVDFFVPPGRSVRLLVTARECDLPRMDPCVATPELSNGNDYPGDHADSFPSATAAVGSHFLKPDGDAYEMKYSIAKVAGVAPGPTPPGSSGVPPCSDSRAPSASFADDDAVHVDDDGLELRGRASDRGCSGLARVELAVARRLGDGRCQSMRADGSLRPPSKCRPPDWIRATGTRNWKLATDRALPDGTYAARVRAIDGAGNVEPYVRRPGEGGNYLTFNAG